MTTGLSFERHILKTTNLMDSYILKRMTVAFTRLKARKIWRDMMRVDIDGLYYDGKLVMKWVDPSDVATRERVIAEYKEIQRLVELDNIGVEYELRDRIIESCF